MESKSKSGPLESEFQIAGEQQHTWTGLEKHGCCSCGWECAFSESGMHFVSRCKQAHARHAEYGIPTIPDEAPEPPFETFQEMRADEPERNQ